MTGLWQVAGHNDLSADEARRLDLFYVDNWSMMKDLKILGRTVDAVFGASGPY
ncbi:sugar transferase [Nocardioides sp. GY 10113]|uniref:sugar transferase n=1 Tax=Nocardioides sp. GY 10113 TaxID=2569761 RepID=UPI0010A90CAE|nr:sugar transferase [Nocardioides sp. GY 10113]TIC88403.1 sugar transferase [Nocardioides sp. GY 10113]